MIDIIVDLGLLTAKTPYITKQTDG